MSLEIEELSADPTISSLIHWAKETSLWDGHQVALEDIPLLQQEIEKKILSILSHNNPSSLAWHSTLANLALLGATDTSRSLIERDIQELRPLQEGIRVCGSFGKSITTFWKKHKAAILIGAGVAAITTTIIIVTACTGGAAAIPVATTGAALGTPPSKKKEPKKEKPNAPASPPPKPPQKPPLPFFPTPDLALLDNLFHFTEKSRPFEIEGVKYQSQSIGFINGIGTNLEGAKANAAHIQKLTPNQHIEGVYNQTHGMVADIAEALTLNFQGISLNTPKELISNWQHFIDANRNNPNSKYLQFCHSKGALEVKNALAQVPKEMRDRIIVVAIAPATIIPRALCHDAFNYASKRDIVPYAELASAGFFDSNETGISERTETAIKNRQELILLDPHPDAKGLDHDFTSPTFQKIIEYHIQQYNEESE